MIEERIPKLNFFVGFFAMWIGIVIIVWALIDLGFSFDASLVIGSLIIVFPFSIILHYSLNKVRKVGGRSK